MKPTKTQKKDLSLGDLIKIATGAAKNSPFGMDTAVCLCEHEREYVPLIDARLDADEDGAVFIISLHKLGKISMDKCEFPRCRNLSDFEYVGCGVCSAHWEKLCEADSKTKDRLLNKIGLIRNDNSGAVVQIGNRLLKR